MFPVPVISFVFIPVLIAEHPDQLSVIPDGQEPQTSFFAGPNLFSQ
jgi:hypothetical protein